MPSSRPEARFLAEPPQRQTSSRRLVCLNGSLRGAGGNTAALLQSAARHWPKGAPRELLVLADYAGSVEGLAEVLRSADAFLFGTGVYWSSWGSPLQRFLEVMSAFELTDCFLGKPAAVLVSMDSVGGMDVAQRLVGVLSLFGCLLPPLSTIVLSRVAGALEGVPGNEDVWQAEDLEPLVQNLWRASQTADREWATWGIRATPPVVGAYPAAGPLGAGLARFAL